jgi:hypothetical protein
MLITMFMGTSGMPHSNTDVDFNMAKKLPIYKYFEDKSIGVIIGNFGETSNHDLKYKIPSGCYVIPIAVVDIVVDFGSYDEDYSFVSMWSKWETNPDLAYLEHGLWEIKYDQIRWNYKSAYEFQKGTQTGDFDMILNTDNVPCTFVQEPVKDFNIVHLLTPVTKYGDESV